MRKSKGGRRARRPGSEWFGRTRRRFHSKSARALNAVVLVLCMAATIAAGPATAFAATTPSASPSTPDSPSPSLSDSPSPSLSETPSASPSDTPSASPSDSPSPSPSPTETPSPSPTDSASLSPSPSDSASPSPSDTNSPTPSSTPTGPTAGLILQMDSGLTAAEQQAVIANDGGAETGSVPALRLHFVDVPAADLSSYAQAYQSDPAVVSVDRDRSRDAEGAPSDPAYPNQWALPQIGWDQAYGSVSPSGSATIAVL